MSIRGTRARIPTAIGGVACVCLFFLISLTWLAHLAEANSGIDSLAPKFEILDRPKAHYKLDDIIHYRIQIRWPASGIPLRMKPPELNVLNLKLLGVSEESVAKKKDSGTQAESEHILNFKFKALKPGAAKINYISLEWSTEEGAAAAKIRLPGTDFRVHKGFPLKTAAASLGSLLAVGAGGWAVFKRLRRKAASLTSLPEPPLSFHDQLLNRLNESHSEWKLSGRNREFLRELGRVAEHYLKRELDWDREKHSYADLKRLAESKWTHKEAALLSSLIQEIEYQKFSGAKLDAGTLENAYQTLFSFIEQKRIISA